MNDKHRNGNVSGTARCRAGAGEGARGRGAGAAGFRLEVSGPREGEGGRAAGGREAGRAAGDGASGEVEAIPTARIGPLGAAGFRGGFQRPFPRVRRVQVYGNPSVGPVLLDGSCRHHVCSSCRRYGEKVLPFVLAFNIFFFFFCFWGFLSCWWFFFFFNRINRNFFRKEKQCCWFVLTGEGAGLRSSCSAVSERRQGNGGGVRDGG